MPSLAQSPLRKLICWFGSSDIKAARERNEANDGPVRMLLRHKRFSDIRLLYTKNQKPEDVVAVSEWLKPHCGGAEVQIISTDVTDPIDYASIYKATADNIKAVRPYPDGRDLTFHLSPGTPVMQCILLLLARLRYPKSCVFQTREERFAQDGKTVLQVRLPEEIDLLLERGELPSDSIDVGTEQGQRLESFAKQVAETPLRILLLGESGTGKSYLAKRIHELSGRTGKLMSVNCAGLSDSLLESELFGYVKGAFTGASSDHAGMFQCANGGTLFLDEIGEMPMSQQATLLRALQDEGDYTIRVRKVGSNKEDVVDVRVIAATNRPLLEAVQDGTFREDLYYRLAEMSYCLPSVSQYAEEEKENLLRHFLGELNETHSQQWSFTTEGWEMLKKERWPGNIREMRFMMRRLCFLTGKKDSIPDSLVEQALGQGRLPGRHSVGKTSFFTLGSGQSLDNFLQDMRKKKIQKALEQAQGNKAEASRLLGIPYQKLVYWINGKKER